MAPQPEEVKYLGVITVPRDVWPVLDGLKGNPKGVTRCHVGSFKVV